MGGPRSDGLRPSAKRFAILAAILSSLPAPDLLAQTTLTVNTANDVDDGVCDVAHCSLREAIDAAN
ncbi:MAG: CSLREA domain-containing protein, partial [Longimicrobiales bacterium]